MLIDCTKICTFHYKLNCSCSFCIHCESCIDKCEFLGGSALTHIWIKNIWIRLHGTQSHTHTQSWILSQMSLSVTLTRADKENNGIASTVWDLRIVRYYGARRLWFVGSNISSSVFLSWVDLHFSRCFHCLEAPRIRALSLSLCAKLFWQW